MLDRIARRFDHSLGRLTMHAIGTAAHAASLAARAHAALTQSEQDIEVERDVPYGLLAEHKLDVYRERSARGTLPVLLYLHGGGFQQLSRRTHRGFAVRFARAGYLVFNADYRLAPGHRYPAATDDARAAAEFILGQARRWGGDSDDLTVAGESAGANLALGLAISQRPCALRACVLFSGLLQVSHPGRLWGESPLSRVLRARIESIPRDYIGPHARDREPQLVDPYLDPLLWLERHKEWVGALPSIYASVGSADPVASDTLRLAKLLDRVPVPHRVEVYPGEPHAFQALPMRKHAQASWRACLEFLAQARAGNLSVHARAQPA